MGAFIIAAAVMISAAVLSDAGRRSEQIDLDRVPPLPENVAVYESIGSDESTRGSDDDPDSCTTIPQHLTALAH
jgi:hypothetical protein